ncbi:hypothetical protein [Synechococcus sp. BA-132 BA5]|uniref:hypothetical protein n=1 Tax=Synechococcus sp. BA-132 BA5 TaxID=3110252 RepID=UPI002B1EADF2|nr:hypothetical protein [Synechococcus sp. BA-132 BA5]MEA5417118.1 hypothetical protein [Synechococcus sp. BA-132 BA5]
MAWLASEARVGTLKAQLNLVETGALDSRTGAEVMALIADLHASGLTIVLVTPDRLGAQNSGRITPRKVTCKHRRGHALEGL